jgi:hypothetical protein
MRLDLKLITSVSKWNWSLTWLLVILIFFGNPAGAQAQSPEDDWTPPVNLSRSGGAINPAIVVDNAGTTHVIWGDTYSGFMYSVLEEEGGWAPPKAVIFPFSPPRNVSVGADYPTPVLFADQRNRIHAFWIDGRGVLNHSSVNRLYISSPGAWTGRRIIAEAAVGMDVTIDANGNLHTAYIRNLSSIYAPAGLYYRTFNTTSFVWSLPTLLDESPYFRSLDAENAKVSIASTWLNESVNLTIGWDNRPRNRISLIKSIDGGSNWSETLVIEGPEVSTVPVVPFNILVGAYEDNIILVWQEDEPGESCNQVFQWSNDDGETWQGKQRMLTNLQGCADDYQFLINDTGQMILMTKILGQVYFQSWDGLRWSDPQLQSILSSFIDQETFNLVDMDCQYALLTPLNEIHVAGCDLGIGGDVWMTNRRIDSVSSWFPPESNWGYPVNVTSSVAITLGSSIVTDEAGNAHLVWSEIEDVNSEGALLQYARSDNVTWSPAQTIVGPPVHYVVNPSITIYQDRLFVAWSDQSSGEIQVVSAPAERAINPREWSSPVTIQLPRLAGSSPDILAGPDGTLYLAFAISINEQRGIYLVQSEDGGSTWSEPATVFDAVDAGWPMVDEPKLTISDDGTLHLIFSRYTANNRSVGVYYALSTNGGTEWTEADSVSEAGISFKDIFATKTGIVHMIWLESNSSHSIWHAYFDNPEERWENRRSVQTSVTKPEVSGLLEDANGDIHLLQVAKEGRAGMTLKHWLWNEPQWNVVDLYQIQVSSAANANSLRGAITPSGQMIAVYALPAIDERANLEMTTVFSVSRSIEIVMDTVVLQPTEEEGETAAPSIMTATPSAAFVEQAEAETAMVVDEPRAPIDVSSPVESQSQWTGLAIGVIVGGLLTILILLAAVRSVRRRGLK